MEKKLRILQLSPQFPFPMTDGGKIGIANILKYLAYCGADIDFFCLVERKPDDKYLEEASKYGRIHICEHSIRNTPRRIFKSLFQKEPLYISKQLSKNVFKSLDKVLNTHEFDAIHADHVSMAIPALYAARHSKAVTGIRMHNLEWEIWQRYADILHGFDPRKLFISCQAKKLRHREYQLLSLADICFPVTDRDQKIAESEIQNFKCLTVTAGVNTDEWRPDDGIERNSGQMILATNYNWIHNVDAVDWFLDEVMPLIRGEYPDARLLLAGRGLPSRFMKMEHLGVKGLGFVDSIKPYMNSSSIYIAPLLVGGGVRIKILEAMAMELPVVATSVSAQGIRAGNNEGLIVCDNPAEYAHSVLSLMRNPDRAVKLGKAARNFIINNHTWMRSVKKIYDSYTKLSGK